MKTYTDKEILNIICEAQREAAELIMQAHHIISERKSSGRACCIAITKGSGVFKADDKVLEVKAGDCLFEPAKTVDYIIEANETLEVLECMPPEM